MKTVLYKFERVKTTTENFVEGEHPVRIRISQGKEKDFIPLEFSSSMIDWDEEKNVPLQSHPRYKELSEKIRQYLDDIAFELKVAQKAGKYISCVEIKRKLLHDNLDLPKENKQLKILEFFDKVINELEDGGNLGYADVFISTRSTVSKLLNDGKFIPPQERNIEKDKPFPAFTKADHQKYERLISIGASESTISLY